MSRPHRAVRVDKNQAEIVADLRKLGAYLWITASLGGEVLDLIVFWRGLAIPVEIKVPGKLNDLTEGEREGIRRLREVGIEPLVATCTEDIVAEVYRLVAARNALEDKTARGFAGP